MEVFCGQCKHYKCKSGGYGSDSYYCKKNIHKSKSKSHDKVKVIRRYGDPREINCNNDCEDFEFSTWRFIQKKRHLKMVEQEKKKGAEELIQKMEMQEEEDILEMDKN